MKTLGRTEQGGVIVELTEAEYKTLNLLTSAMNDIPADRAVFYDFDRGPFTMHPLGLTPAFQAILAFAHAKLQVNSLQALVDSLNRCLVPIVKKEPISKTESGWVKVEEQQTDSPHPWEKYNDE